MDYSSQSTAMSSKNRTATVLNENMLYKIWRNTAQMKELILFAKLDLVFKDETVHNAYNTYSNFISFNKKDDMSNTDYILRLNIFIVR